MEKPCKKKKYSQAKHKFGKLEEIMKVCKLRYVMSTTVEINSLVELTQSYLDKKRNYYKYEKQNIQKLLTKYRDTCDSEIGHDIHGPKPLLIKLRKSSDLCEDIVLIAFLLLEIIGIKSKRIAIIHFDKHELLWFQLLFEVTNHFSRVTVTSDVEKFIKDLDNVVLVTSYNCVRGLEFFEVLLILDADEYHLKQFIPEVMARCMNKLQILVLTTLKENSKSDTVRDLVDYWHVFQKIEKPVLEILSLRFCSRTNFKKHENYKETHCVTHNGNYTFYNIHKRCEMYGDLVKTIQRSYLNLHLEEKKL